MDWFLLGHHTRGILQYLSFCVWLVSLSIMPSRFIQAVAWVRISLFSMLRETSYLWNEIILCGTNCSLPTSVSYDVKSKTFSHQKVKCNWFPSTSSLTNYTLLEASLAQEQEALVLCVRGPQDHPQDINASGWFTENLAGLSIRLYLSYDLLQQSGGRMGQSPEGAGCALWSPQQWSPAGPS